MPKIKTLEDFINSPERNCYINYKGLHSYVRKSDRIIDGKRVKTLDRANTVNKKTKNRYRNVETENNPKSTGLYKELDNHMHKQAAKHGFDGVYVESVQNKFLPNKLKEYGYKQVVNPGELEHNLPSFYKPVDKNLANGNTKNTIKEAQEEFKNPPTIKPILEKQKVESKMTDTIENNTLQFDVEAKIISHQKMLKYSLPKVHRDHASFMRVLAKHFQTPHKWVKTITSQQFAHRFIPKGKNEPIVIVKRRHVTLEPHYVVRVKVPHPTDPTKNHIYNRAIRTMKPSETMHRLLIEAKAAKLAGKQIRNRG